MLVTMGSKTYSMGKKTFKNMVKTAREKMIGDNVNAIFALEKDQSAMLVKQIFTTGEALDEVADSYKATGYKVHKVYKV